MCLWPSPPTPGCPIFLIATICHSNSARSWVTSLCQLRNLHASTCLQAQINLPLRYVFLYPHFKKNRGHHHHRPAVRLKATFLRVNWIILQVSSSVYFSRVQSCCHWLDRWELNLSKNKTNTSLQKKPPKNLFFKPTFLILYCFF